MTKAAQKLTRGLVDKVGFAHTLSQMEAVLHRIEKYQGDILRERRDSLYINQDTSWKTAICPHDDYTYTGYLYPLVLQQVKTPLVFIIAVAHKAAQFNLENNIVFDDFDQWTGIRKPITVSSMRTELQNELPADIWQVHKEMQQIEHSIESMLPFLQYYNPDVEIVPILVPFMPFDRIQKIADTLAEGIKNATANGTFPY